LLVVLAEGGTGRRTAPTGAQAGLPFSALKP